MRLISFYFICKVENEMMRVKAILCVKRFLLAQIISVDSLVLEVAYHVESTQIGRYTMNDSGRMLLQCLVGFVWFLNVLVSY